MFGDGGQSRSNTYVADCVAATVAALDGPRDGAIFNVGGGREIKLLDAIAILARHLDVDPVIEHAAARPGDQRRTVADITKARELLGWKPTIGPEEGLLAEVHWVQQRSTER